MNVDHELKTENPWFDLIWDKKKTFEIRYNDRDFEPGQMLRLRHYDRGTNTYGDRSIYVEIDQVFRHWEMPGIEPGWVVLMLDAAKMYNECSNSKL